ncbi:MAG: type IX secretion system protein PorQ [Bacteroidota bacterium]|nr:type IX secretion system protein PorQ [Bacteroidota bacterium]
MYKAFYILLFFSSLCVYGQIGGQSVYTFLNMMNAPRQAALGGRVVTLYDYDVSQAVYNPAVINDMMNNRLAVNYGNYFGEVSYGTAAYAFGVDKYNKMFHVGVNYINYGSFEARDEYGVQSGTFTGSETALSVGYAHQVPDSKFHLAANLKFITSVLESYNSLGMAIDLGVVYRNPESTLNASLVLRNMGMQLTTYAGTKEKIPFEIIAGISQELENVPVRWHVTLDNLQQWNISYVNPAQTQQGLDGSIIEKKPSFLNNALRHLSFGVEIFPQKAINLRLGYNFRRGQELALEEHRTFAGISAGFGLRMGKLRFDYSYSRFTSAGSTSIFGLMINL